MRPLAHGRDQHAVPLGSAPQTRDAKWTCEADSESNSREAPSHDGLRGEHQKACRLPRALATRKNEGREIRTPNLLIWSQTCYRCAIPPVPSNALKTSMGSSHACGMHGVDHTPPTRRPMNPPQTHRQLSSQLTLPAIEIKQFSLNAKHSAE